MLAGFNGRVRDLSFQGFGVVDHPSGLVFFVAGAWPGDEGEFEILETQKKYGFARLTQLTSPSPDRVTPPCKHHGFTSSNCGGCGWMMVRYEAQLAAKENILRHQLLRASLPQESLQPIRPSPVTLGYRNRVQLKSDGKHLGYMAFHQRSLVNIEECPVLNNKNQDHLKTLRSQLPNPHWNPKGTDTWNYLELDDDIETLEVTINQRRPFKQSNSLQNLWMKTWVEDKISGSLSGIELFCGSGNFTKILHAKGVAPLVGVEISSAVLQQESLPGFSKIQGDVLRPSTWNRIRTHLRNPDLLFLDPPREGFHNIDKFIKSFPSINQIMYVSCDVRSFVRDVQKLVACGFCIQEIQPVDQLPHTPHLEILGYLTRATGPMLSQRLQ